MLATGLVMVPGIRERSFEFHRRGQAERRRRKAARGGGGRHQGGGKHHGGKHHKGHGRHHHHHWRRNNGRWVRLADYWWIAGGAIAAGVAIGYLSYADAAAWTYDPPGPGYCWYYTDPARENGFWDLCP